MSDVKEEFLCFQSAEPDVKVEIGNEMKTVARKSKKKATPTDRTWFAQDITATDTGLLGSASWRQRSDEIHPSYVQGSTWNLVIRAFFVLITSALILLPASAVPDETFLLIDRTEIEAARRKAEKYPWAHAALSRLVADAEQSLKEPVSLPNRGGQYSGWYSCKKDGVPLKTVSPTEHRCPACGAVYRGDPYDAVLLTRVHLGYSRAVRDLGLAYRFTGRAEFARRAGIILAAYADRYHTYPYHTPTGPDKPGGGRVTAQSLDESIWLISMTWGYSLVRDTFSEAARRHVENDLLVTCANVILPRRSGIHNIQCWRNSAFGLVGFVTGKQELVREAIDDPDRGFRAQIARGITDDGLWFEGSLGYHNFTMQALWPLAEAARHAGIDLYSDRYRKLYDAPLALALPNGDLPGFADGAGGNVTASASPYEIAYARWHQPAHGRLLSRTNRESLEALLYGAEEVPSGPIIPEQSTLLKAAGFAMLRAGSSAVAVRFGMYGAGHAHPDKLNIITYSAGQLLGLDPGSISYSAPLWMEWYKTTIAHNTVSVDQQVQAVADGQLEKWAAEPAVTTLVAMEDKVYPGVTLRRSLTLRTSELADRFECIAGGEHIYDWAFHAPGRLTTSLSLTPRSSPLGESNGYQHIEKLAEGRTDGDWWVRWDAGNARLTLRMKGAPGTEVFTGVGPGKNPAERVPLIIVRRRATRTVFEAVHQIENH